MAQHMCMLTTCTMVSLMVSLVVVTMTQADSGTDCTKTCKGCIDISESFKRVQCKITCEAFNEASPFDCSNVDPIPPKALKEELETFERSFLDLFAANKKTELLNRLDNSYKLVPVGIDPFFGKEKALQFYVNWRTLNANDLQSESAVVLNCGENDGYVWMHGIAYGYSLPNQGGTRVETMRYHRLMKRAAGNSLKVYVDVFTT